MSNSYESKLVDISYIAVGTFLLTDLAATEERLVDRMVDLACSYLFIGLPLLAQNN